MSVASPVFYLLAGPNGAGKSSLLKAISGLVKNKKGSISYNGRELIAENPVEIVKAGIVMSPEGRRIFPRLTVEDNLLLGAFARKDADGIAKDLERVYDLFDILRERRTQPAGTFSGGEQQMLAIGRAMMSRPKLLMLDEPSMGLSPLMMQRIMSTIRTLQSEGVTILLVEQNAAAALKLSDWAYVLEVGQITLDGTGEQLLGDDRVRRAYLGED